MNFHKLLILTTLLYLFIIDPVKAQYNNDEEIDILKNTIYAHLETFGNYLSLIADKTLTLDVRTNRIEDALNLFYNPLCKVSISSLKKNKPDTSYINEYLNDLMYLPYRMIKIKWVNINITRLIKLNDTAFIAEAEITQLFIGKNNNVLNYRKLEGVNYQSIEYNDITTKTVQVFIEKKKDIDSDQYWYNILFCEIGVKETRKL